jgi:hypothetical protein
MIRHTFILSIFIDKKSSFQFLNLDLASLDILKIIYLIPINNRYAALLFGCIVKQYQVK